jgi:hypothetical protein
MFYVLSVCCVLTGYRLVAASNTVAATAFLFRDLHLRWRELIPRLTRRCYATAYSVGSSISPFSPLPVMVCGDLHRSVSRELTTGSEFSLPVPQSLSQRLGRLNCCRSSSAQSLLASVCPRYSTNIFILSRCSVEVKALCYKTEGRGVETR